MQNIEWQESVIKRLVEESDSVLIDPNSTNDKAESGERWYRRLRGVSFELQNVYVCSGMSVEDTYAWAYEPAEAALPRSFRRIEAIGQPIQRYLWYVEGGAGERIARPCDRVRISVGESSYADFNEAVRSGRERLVRMAELRGAYQGSMPAVHVAGASGTAFYNEESSLPSGCGPTGQLVIETAVPQTGFGHIYELAAEGRLNRLVLDVSLEVLQSELEEALTEHGVALTHVITGLTAVASEKLTATGPMQIPCKHE